ncbi:MAG: glucose-1-phosphate adenylyltransferase, partial [Polaribacter sp.]
CVISAEKIEKSVIGIRSRIGKETIVTNTYMMGNDAYESLEEIKSKGIENQLGIGDRCFINNCIIDKNCRIGDDTRINGGLHLKDVETNTYFVKDGIVVIKKGAVLPKGTVI